VAQRSFRLPQSLAEEIGQAVQENGYASTAAFMRTAIQNELKRRRQTNQVKGEQAVKATLEGQGKELKALRNTLQAHFALTDALARMILPCMPEPPAEAHAQALARAKERHDKFLKMTALSMNGNAKAILAELVNHEEE
jgi:Arc/MetJ-type ribon-helix-helix transcriptional regulator